MFIIRGNGRFELMGNAKEDDFLQFMPKYFKCPKEALEVWYVPPENEALAGEVNWLESDPVEAGIGQKLKAWPYNPQGGFMGNKVEGEE